MKIPIDKITFKNDQAWVVMRSQIGEDYIGTWHITNKEFVKFLRESNPKEIVIGDSK